MCQSSGLWVWLFVRVFCAVNSLNREHLCSEYCLLLHLKYSRRSCVLCTNFIQNIPLYGRADASASPEIYVALHYPVYDRIQSVQWLRWHRILIISTTTNDDIHDDAKTRRDVDGAVCVLVDETTNNEVRGEKKRKSNQIKQHNPIRIIIIATRWHR